MTPFLTEVTTSLVCVVSMAEALLSRVCCDGDRDSDRVRREAGGRVAEMAWYEAGASIGVLRNQRQHRPKRISFAVRALAAGLVLCSLAASACTAAPTGGGRWVFASVPARESGTGERDTRVWLPPSYDRPESATRRYPPLVVLHGWRGAEGTWPAQGRGPAPRRCPVGVSVRGGRGAEGIRPAEGRAGETLGRLIAAGRIPEVI